LEKQIIMQIEKLDYWDPGSQGMMDSVPLISSQ